MHFVLSSGNTGGNAQWPAVRPPTPAAYRAAGQWRICFALAARAGWSADQHRRLAAGLADELSAIGRGAEAAAISLEYLKNVDSAGEHKKEVPLQGGPTWSGLPACTRCRELATHIRPLSFPSRLACSPFAGSRQGVARGAADRLRQWPVREQRSLEMELLLLRPELYHWPAL